MIDPIFFTYISSLWCCVCSAAAAVRLHLVDGPANPSRRQRHSPEHLRSGTEIQVLGEASLPAAAEQRRWRRLCGRGGGGAAAAVAAK